MEEEKIKKVKCSLCDETYVERRVQQYLSLNANVCIYCDSKYDVQTDNLPEKLAAKKDGTLKAREMSGNAGNKFELAPEHKEQMERKRAREEKRLLKEEKQANKLDKKIEKRDKIMLKEEKEQAIEIIIKEYEKAPEKLYALSKQYGITYASARHQLMKRGLLKARNQHTGEAPEPVATVQPVEVPAVSSPVVT